MGDKPNSERGSNRVNRRKVLLSSAAGGAFLGSGGIIGSVAAEGDSRRGTHPTPEELRRSLRESDHIGLRPEHKEAINKDEIASVDELPTSATPGRDHPEIYYGEFKNAQAPSGKYFRESDSDETNYDTDNGPISVDGSEVGPNFFSISEEVGCQGFGPFGELCAVVGVGVDLEYDYKKFGGNLYLDLTLEHSSGAQVTVSPAGFGIYVGTDDEEGLCTDLKLRMPGPIPGKGDVELCLNYAFTVEGSDVLLTIEVTGLEVCLEDETVCVDIVSGSIGFEGKIAEVSDVPFL